jgi:hypothetical protein
LWRVALAVSSPRVVEVTNTLGLVSADERTRDGGRVIRYKLMRNGSQVGIYETRDAAMSMAREMHMLEGDALAEGHTLREVAAEQTATATEIEETARFAAERNWI